VAARRATPADLAIADLDSGRRDLRTSYTIRWT